MQVVRMYSGAGAAAASAAGTLAAAAVPIPVVSEVTGWAVNQSIKWLVETAGAVVGYPQHCRELLEVLKKPRLLRTAEALDQLTDLPEHEDFREDYLQLYSRTLALSLTAYVPSKQLRAEAGHVSVHPGSV
jgi:hypothetical protein